MSRLSSPPLPQARFLRTLERIWIGTATVSTIILTVYFTSFVSTSVEQVRTSRSRDQALARMQNRLNEEPVPARPMASAAGLQDMRPGSVNPPNPGQPSAPASIPESSVRPSAPAPAAATHVISGSTSVAGANAGIEAKLGPWLNRQQCQPDLPIYANVRGQWREGTIVDVRQSVVMVRFVDSSFSDEECSISQLRARSGAGKPPGPSSPGTASLAPTPPVPPAAIAGGSTSPAPATPTPAPGETATSARLTSASDVPAAMTRTKSPLPSRTGWVSMPTRFYRAQDAVEVVTQNGAWKPATVKRVVGSHIVCALTESPDSSVPLGFLQVRMTYDQASTRGWELLQARQAAYRQSPRPPRKAYTRETNPERYPRLTDLIPGMLITGTRKVNSSRLMAVVVGIDGSFVTIRYKTDGTEETLPIEKVWPEFSYQVRPADEYKPDQLVYANQQRGIFNSWALCRVQKVEGDKIIMQWGEDDDSSLEERTLSIYEVRALSMDNGK